MAGQNYLVFTPRRPSIGSIKFSLIDLEAEIADKGEADLNK